VKSDVRAVSGLALTAGAAGVHGIQAGGKKAKDLALAEQEQLRAAAETERMSEFTQRQAELLGSLGLNQIVKMQPTEDGGWQLSVEDVEPGS